MNWYLQVFKKYFCFSGRARRKEYWMFYLINFFVTIGFAIFDVFLNTGGSLCFIYVLISIIPTIGLSFRRLHDTDRSAWWLLLYLLPLIGLIVIFIFNCLPGTVGINRFGSDPKMLKE